MAPLLILANGEPPPAALLARWRAACGEFWCTDGAVCVALAAGLVPEVVIGDMDSAPADLPSATERIAIAEQDTTDLEKALYTAVARGFERVVVLGAGGRRWDQFVGNLSVFARYAERLELQAGDGHGWLQLLRPGEHQLELPTGTKFSLLALPEAAGVRLSGACWPLDGATLRLGERDAISNEVTAPPVVVAYERGCLGFYQVERMA